MDFYDLISNANFYPIIVNIKHPESDSFQDKLRFLNKPFFHYVLICITGLIVYSNTFDAPFQWDEQTFLLDNPIVKDLHYFLEPSSAQGLQYYNALRSRYIGYLSFAINYKIHGIHVPGYHILNICIHLLNALLVYSIVTLSFRTPFLIHSQLKKHSAEIALFSALCFVSHPVQTEAVTYIFQRLASLVTLFYLFSIVMYIKARLESQKQTKARFSTLVLTYHFLSIVSAVLAMKTKENAFTLPVVAALYELFFFKGYVKQRLLHLIPLLLTLFIIPLTFIGIDKPVGEIISQIQDPAPIGFQGIPRGDYLFTQIRVIVTYIRLLFLPINQNLVYDYPHYHSFLKPGVLLSFLLLLSIIGSGCYLLFRSRLNSDLRLISFGIFWFFITLSVESSIIPLPMVIDEYRVYLPSVGMFVALISGIFLIIEKFRDEKIRTFLAPSLFILLVVFSVAAYERNSLWGSSISLWEDVVKKSPKDARGHYNLGNAYKAQGLFDKAIEQYRITQSLMSVYAEAYNNLGVAYDAKGFFDMAIDQYQMALNLKPDLVEAHNNLGKAYWFKGLFDMAITQCQIAVNLKPDLVEAHNNLGNAYASKGLFDMAITQYQIAVNLKPDYIDAHFNLGITYLKNGAKDMARREFEFVLKIKPDDYEAQKVLSRITE